MSNLEDIGVPVPESDAEVIARLEKSNPPLAEILKRHAGEVGSNKESSNNSEQLVITPLMRREAAARDRADWKRLRDDYK